MLCQPCWSVTSAASHSSSPLGPKVAADAAAGGRAAEPPALPSLLGRPGAGREEALEAGHARPAPAGVDDGSGRSGLDGTSAVAPSVECSAAAAAAAPEEPRPAKGCQTWPGAAAPAKAPRDSSGTWPAAQDDSTFCASDLEALRLGGRSSSGPPKTGGRFSWFLRPAVSGPLLVEDARDHWPFFTVAQGFLALLLWLAAAASQADGGRSLFERQGGLDTWFPGQTAALVHRDCEDFRGDGWRWVTYQFTHGNFMHIAINFAMLLDVGIPLERFHGPLRVAAVFELGVVTGGLCQAMFTPHMGALIGMSGGVFALIGMAFAEVVANWRQSRRRYVKLTIVVPLLIMTVVLFCINITEDKEEYSATATGAASHLAGCVFGVWAGLLFGRSLRKKSNLGKLFAALFLLSLCVVAAWFVMLVNFSTTWPPRSAGEGADRGWCWVRLLQNTEEFGDDSWRCAFCSDQACIGHWKQMNSTNVSFVYHAACDMATAFRGLPR